MELVPTIDSDEEGSHAVDTINIVVQHPAVQNAPVSSEPIITRLLCFGFLTGMIYILYAVSAFILELLRVELANTTDHKLLSLLFFQCEEYKNP